MITEKTTMKTFLVTVICLLGILLSVQTASACTCKPGSAQSTIKRLRKESAAIFVGKVRQITREFKDYRLTLKVSFSVEQTWKGPQDEEIVVYTEGGCMASYQVDRTYIVYAYKGETGRLETIICMRNRRLEDAGEDLKRLGKPRKKFTTGSTAILKRYFMAVGRGRR